MDGKKISGVLLERGQISSAGHADIYVLVGIGLNVASYPSDTVYPAISIVEAGCTASLDKVRDLLTEAFLARLKQWKESGFAGIRNVCALLLDGVGSMVQVATDRERKSVISGRNLGIDKDRGLLLKLRSGEVRCISAGDVIGPAH